MFVTQSRNQRPFNRRQDDLYHFVFFLSGLVDPSVIVEPLTEEKAARTLYRIELLRKIREQVCKV